VNAVSIGPLVFAADRASALIGIAVFMAVSALVARKLGGPLRRWASLALAGGLVAARLVHVALNWESFSHEPWRVIAFWQGGFFWPAGIAAALLLLFPLLRDWSSRLAGLASIAAGLFIWHSATLLTAGIEAIPLPAQPLQTMAGEAISLKELGDGPMVINLWASWCPPCRREMPMMEEVAAVTTGASFVFANQGESASHVSAFFAQQGLDLPNSLLDGLGRLGRHYRVAGLPATLFIDGEGRLADLHLGEISREALTAKIAALKARTD
jgi:thiol-disulfide isomerase/thioredoxin